MNKQHLWHKVDTSQKMFRFLKKKKKSRLQFESYSGSEWAQFFKEDMCEP